MTWSPLFFKIQKDLWWKSAKHHYIKVSFVNLTLLFIIIPGVFHLHQITTHFFWIPTVGRSVWGRPPTHRAATPGQSCSLTPAHTDLDWAVNEQWEDSPKRQITKLRIQAHPQTSARARVCARCAHRRTYRRTDTRVDRKYVISTSAAAVCLSSCHTPCRAEPIWIVLWWHICCA